MTEPITEDKVRLICHDVVTERTNGMVTRPFCIERHKEVSALSDKIKSIDGRLWGLVVLGLAQLVAVIIAITVK